MGTRAGKAFGRGMYKGSAIPFEMQAGEAFGDGQDEEPARGGNMVNPDETVRINIVVVAEQVDEGQALRRGMGGNGGAKDDRGLSDLAPEVEDAESATARTMPRLLAKGDVEHRRVPWMISERR